MSVTIKEVAEAACVSVGTVSRALNGHPTVGPDKAERVMRAVRKLKYRPLRNRTEDSGRGSLKGKNIGLLLLGLARSLASLPCVANAVQGVEAALNSAGANLLLADLPRADRVPVMFERWRVDGVLLKGALLGGVIASGNPELFERLRQFPSVWFLGRPDGADWGDVVQSNDWSVGRLAVSHLRERGHNHLAVLNPKPEHGTFRRREASFTWHAQRAGSRIDVYWPDPQPWSIPLQVSGDSLINELVAKLLLAKPRPTAVFVPGDSVAASVYRALSERGLRVGKDLSLISCNREESLMRGLHPDLTTINIHAEEIGRRAADLLAWRLAHESASFLDIGVEPLLAEGHSVEVL